MNLGAYRYYSFTLMDDKNVRNVTFKLNTLHGDADIYVSRRHKFPSKSENEKMSAMRNDMADQVDFSADEGKEMKGTYYVAIYSA